MMANEALTLAILAISIVAGIPHGTMDFFVARRLGLFKTPPQLASWVVKYLTLSLAVVVCWCLAPAFTLAAFLILSAIHFGRDFFPTSWFRALSTGAFILGLPAFFHGHLVVTYFELLWLTDEHAKSIVSVMTWAFSLSLLVNSYHLIISKNYHLNIKLLLEILSLIVIAWFFNPLIYFALYFAMSHSPRHLATQWRKLPSEVRVSALMIMTGLTLLPILVGVLIILLLSLPLFDSSIAVIFIGLAALTFPHMLLIEQDMKKSQNNG